MSTAAAINFKAIVEAFQLHGDFISAAPYGSGHINDTFVAKFNQSGRPMRYILQRVNENIFKQAEALMENVKRVTEHQMGKLLEGGVADASRRALTLVYTREGDYFYRDDEHNLWRVYLFIEDATGHDQIKTAAQAEAAARAFGAFQQLLVDLPGGPLHETIPFFHNTQVRFENLVKAMEADSHNRAADVKAELDFALARAKDVGVLLDMQAAGEIPMQVTHNDTKLNNVLLDNLTGEGLCVIDLDTVMPGLALYDFGDMVRTATNSGAEDERDLSQITMRMPIFEALVRGYLSTAGAFLTPAEHELLPFAGKLMTLECGLRFLTDYLQGDIYFKTHREGHNVDRCRTQFKLVQSIEEQGEAMLEVVRATLKG